jgi:hypothetical protein
VLALRARKAGAGFGLGWGLGADGFLFLAPDLGADLIARLRVLVLPDFTAFFRFAIHTIFIRPAQKLVNGPVNGKPDDDGRAMRALLGKRR